MTQPFILSAAADWLLELLFGSNYGTALRSRVEHERWRHYRDYCGGQEAYATRLVRHNTVYAMRSALRIRLPAGALGAFFSP